MSDVYNTRQDLTNITKAAKAGGMVLRKYFGENVATTEKTAPADFRTKVDVISERAILKVIKQTFPAYNIYAEESGKVNNGSDYTIIIDPLDGTNNFALGIPYFSVCLAVMHEKETIAAVIHNPVTKQTFHAQKGQGAFMNQAPLRVSKVSSLKKASLAYVSSYKMSDRPTESRILKNILISHVKRAMTNWSPAMDMCLLAQGRLDVYINNRCEIYDYAAGKLIAQEAGAQITDLKGQPEKNDLNDRFVISNGTRLHKEVLKLVS